MASTGLGDFPLQGIALVEGLIDPVGFGNKTTAAADALTDYFFGTQALPPDNAVGDGLTNSVLLHRRKLAA